MALCPKFNLHAHSLSDLNTVSTHEHAVISFYICTQMRGAILEQVPQPEHINVFQTDTPSCHFSETAQENEKQLSNFLLGQLHVYSYRSQIFYSHECTKHTNQANQFIDS